MLVHGLRGDVRTCSEMLVSDPTPPTLPLGSSTRPMRRSLAGSKVTSAQSTV